MVSDGDIRVHDKSYIPTMNIVSLDKQFINEAVLIVKEHQKVYSTDIIGSTGKKRNCFVVVICWHKKDRVLWVARIQLLFKMKTKH